MANCRAHVNGQCVDTKRQGSKKAEKQRAGALWNRRRWLFALLHCFLCLDCEVVGGESETVEVTEGGSGNLTGAEEFLRDLLDFVASDRL